MNFAFQISLKTQLQGNTLPITSSTLSMTECHSDASSHVAIPTTALEEVQYVLMRLRMSLSLYSQRVYNITEKGWQLSFSLGVLPSHTLYTGSPFHLDNSPMSLATEFLPFWRSRPVGEPAWILLAFYIFFFPPLFSNFPVSYLPNASKLLLNYFCSKQYFLMNFRLHSTNLDDKKRTSLLLHLVIWNLVLGFPIMPTQKFNRHHTH